MREKKVRDVGTVTANDIIEDCASLVKRACLPVEPGEHTTPQIDRAARRLGLSPYQVKRLWYRERRDISAHEYINLHQRIAALHLRAAERGTLIDEIRAKVGRTFPDRTGDDAGPLVAEMRARGGEDR